MGGFLTRSLLQIFFKRKFLFKVFVFACLFACQKNETIKSNRGLANAENDNNEGDKGTTGSNTQNDQKANNPLDISSMFSTMGGGDNAGSGNGGNTPGGNKQPLSGDKDVIKSRFKSPYLSMRLNPTFVFFKDNSYPNFKNKPFKDYKSQKDIEDQRNGKAAYKSEYMCPGYSFLVGSRSVYKKKGDKKRVDPTWYHIPSYDKKNILDNVVDSDRMFHQYCQFFEDGSGDIVKRYSCTGFKQAVKAGTTNMGPEGNGFKCPLGRIMAGHMTLWDAEKKDRSHYFNCCRARRLSDGKRISFIMQEKEIKIEDNKTLKKTAPAACEQQQRGKFQGIAAAIDPNTDYGNVDFKCASPDTALYKVGGRFVSRGDDVKDKVNDRVFNYQCCKIGVEGVAPKAQPAGGGRP